MLPDASDPSDRQKQLLLNALVTYGDACSLPLLTPECPYYQISADGSPNCENECRNLLASMGDASRLAREVNIGGLVLRGQALPRSAASGMSEFDARQKYLEDRRKPVRLQCSSSLLLGLQAKLTRMPPITGETGIAATVETWEELTRRGFPVERVARQGILPGMAGNVAALAAAPYLQDAGLLPADASDDFFSQIREYSQRGWGRLLGAAFVDEGSPQAAISAAAWRPARFIALDAKRIQADGLVEEQAALSTVLRSDNPAHQHLIYCFSGRFVNRIAEWMSRLLTQNVSDVAGWAVPPVPVFCALPHSGVAPDEEAHWLWERYTETRLEDWSDGSLLQEWRAQSGFMEPPVLASAWAERRTERDRVAHLALLKTSAKSASRKPRRERGLNAEEFVNNAVELLVAGETERAADIFGGLVDLNPRDGEALNNLGFCLLPHDPAAALPLLQQASLLKRLQPAVNLVNRVLALHLLGRNDDALRLAAEAPYEDRSSWSTWLWRHESCSSELGLDNIDDVSAYLQRLVGHIEECLMQ